MSPLPATPPPPLPSSQPLRQTSSVHPPPSQCAATSHSRWLQEGHLGHLGRAWLRICCWCCGLSETPLQIRDRMPPSGTYRPANRHTSTSLCRPPFRLCCDACCELEKVRCRKSFTAAVCQGGCISSVQAWLSSMTHGCAKAPAHAHLDRLIILATLSNMLLGHIMQDHAFQCYGSSCHTHQIISHEDHVPSLEEPFAAPAYHQQGWPPSSLVLNLELRHLRACMPRPVCIKHCEVNKLLLWQLMLDAHPCLPMLLDLLDLCG